MGILDIAKRSKAIVANVHGLVAEAVKAEEERLVNINKRQMLAFKKGDGTDMPDLSPAYAEWKGDKKSNLKLTGDLHKDMYLETNGREFFISSLDSKTLKFTTNPRWGEEVFGIAPKSRPEAQRITVESLKKVYYRKLLNG